MASSLRLQRKRHFLVQPLERDLAIAVLGARVVGAGTDYRPKLRGDRIALFVGQSSRCDGVPADLGSRVGAIGVLATWPARSTECPTQLGLGGNELVSH